MAKTQFLMVALALMAVAAVAAPAPGCKEVASKQTGYLQTATPAGCLSPNITGTEGLVDVACFESVLMNVTNSTGCPTDGAIFNVSFVNMTCLDGMIIGGGKLLPDNAGGQVLKGEFPLAGMKFAGVRDAAGMFTVSVDGVNCELAYGPKKRVGPLKAAAAKTIIPAVPGDNDTAASATPAAAPAEATTPAAPAKSSAAVAGVNAAVVMVLGAALALAF